MRCIESETVPFVSVSPLPDYPLISNKASYGEWEGLNTELGVKYRIFRVGEVRLTLYLKLIHSLDYVPVRPHPLYMMLLLWLVQSISLFTPTSSLSRRLMNLIMRCQWSIFLWMMALVRDMDMWCIERPYHQPARKSLWHHSMTMEWYVDV